MTNSNSGVSGGIGVSGLLGVAFIVLKLCEVIDWSWWWVTAPLWGPAVLALVFILVGGAIALTCLVAANGIDLITKHWK